MLLNFLLFNLSASLLLICKILLLLSFYRFQSYANYEFFYFIISYCTRDIAGILICYFEVILSIDLIYTLRKPFSPKHSTCYFYYLFAFLYFLIRFPILFCCSYGKYGKAKLFKLSLEKKNWPSRIFM
jgi:hypothetical protein